MKIFKIDTVDYETLSIALRKDFSMYGDLLEFLTIKPYDLPSEFSASIISVAGLFDGLMKLYGNLLESYLGLAMLKKGYIEQFQLDAEFTPEEMESFYLDNSQNEFSEPSGILYFRGEREEIVIHILYEKPMFWNGGNLGFSIESTVEAFIEEQQKYPSYKESKQTIDYVIPDPFLFRLFKDELIKSKSHLEERLPGWEFLSVEQFMDRYLSDEHNDYKEEFREVIKSAKHKLEEEFPFLSISKHLSEISGSRNEIKDSIYRSADLVHNDPEELIRKATKGVEGLLLAIYWKVFKEEPEKAEFNFMLSKLREVLEEEYGTDVYHDLEYLHGERNFSSHTGHPAPDAENTLKVIHRSKLFLDLFDRKFGYNQ
jgi:hypothetical protein